MALSTFLASGTQVLASGSSDGDATSWAWFLLLAGPIFYAAMFVRYRNTDKRHKHESETRATMHDVRGSDQYHRSLKGVSHSSMKGANNEEVRGARTGIARSLGLGG